jgi:hypothetical protein
MISCNTRPGRCDGLELLTASHLPGHPSAGADPSESATGSGWPLTQDGCGGNDPGAGLPVPRSQRIATKSKRPPQLAASFYFSEELTEENTVFRLLPKPFTAAIIASAIPAAIRPYSIAVAPDSSDENLNKLRFKTASVGGA